jgi:hypothetical protein
MFHHYPAQIPRLYHCPHTIQAGVPTPLRTVSGMSTRFAPQRSRPLHWNRHFGHAIVPLLLLHVSMLASLQATKAHSICFPAVRNMPGPPQDWRHRGISQQDALLCRIYCTCRICAGSLSWCDPKPRSSGTVRSRCTVKTSALAYHNCRKPVRRDTVSMSKSRC